MARIPRLPLLVAALSLAALPALAGCIGSAQAASAKENLGAADAAAKAWDPDAQLAQVVGVEGTFASLVGAIGMGSSQDFSQASDDENVGDGLAEIWAYRYLAPTKAKSFVVVLDKAGTILRESEEQKRDDDLVLGAWSVDSDAALEKAVAVNADLAKGLGSRYFGTVAVLHQQEGGAVWLVAGGGGDIATGGGGGQVVIDAVSGKVLSSEGGSGPRGY